MSDIRAVRPAKHTIDLGDGVEREVYFSLNAMADLEEKYGSVEAAFDKCAQNNISAIRYLLWCLLNTSAEEQITERQVGELINLQNLGELMETVMDYLEEAMPQLEELNAKNQTAPTW